MSEKVEYVSQREFARRVDRSHVWINRRVKDGRIPHVEGFGIPFEEGLKAFRAMDSVEGEAVRKRNAREREELRKKKSTSKRRQGAKSKTSTVVTRDEAEALDMTGADATAVSEEFNRARLKEKQYQARLRELEYKREKRSLVPIEEVRADAAATSAHMRAALLALPSRVSARCEGKSARDIEIEILEEVNAVLKELQRSVFGGDEE